MSRSYLGKMVYTNNPGSGKNGYNDEDLRDY